MGLWLFGLLIGSAVVFLLRQQRVSQQAKALKHTRMRLEQMEREHERQIRNATQKLQEDYGQRLAEQKASYQRQLREQKARLQAEFTQQTAALEQKYATYMQLQNHPLELIHQKMAMGEGEDTPSSVSTVLATPETIEQAVTSLTSPALTVPESAPPSLQVPSAPALDPVNEPPASDPGYTQPARPPLLTGEVSLNALAAASQQANPADRKQVATTLGQFLTGNKRAQAQRSVPILSKLIQDPDPSVRRAAVEALGRMNAPKVIPLLKRALRDTDSDVVQTASIALSKFKGASSSKASQSKTRKKLPKNR